MKTFKDLVFSRKSYKYDLGKQAVLFFENKYGISVITGKGSYSNETKPYEIAVLQGDDFENSICYTTEITNYVIGWLTEDEVSEIMIKIQQLN